MFLARTQDGISLLVKTDGIQTCRGGQNGNFKHMKLLTT